MEYKEAMQIRDALDNFRGYSAHVKAQYSEAHEGLRYTVAIVFTESASHCDVSASEHRHELELQSGRWGLELCEGALASTQDQCAWDLAEIAGVSVDLALEADEAIEELQERIELAIDIAIDEYQTLRDVA